MQIVWEENVNNADIIIIVLDISQERMWKQMPRGRPNKISGKKELQEKIDKYFKNDDKILKRLQVI